MSTPDEAIRIQIENCNNIKSGTLTLMRNHLNIKYGPNGTGKTTVSRAIALSSPTDDDQSAGLADLRSFDPEWGDPAVSLSTPLPNIVRFDEEYVDQFVFQDSELLKNSFDVFFGRAEILQVAEDLTSLLVNALNELISRPAWQSALEPLARMSTACKTKSDGSLASNSSFARALEKTRELQKATGKFPKFSRFFKSPEPEKWLKWHIDGSEQWRDDSHCPYCGTEISERDEILQASSGISHPAWAKHLSELAGLLPEWLSLTSAEAQNRIPTDTSQWTPELESVFLSIVAQGERLQRKLTTIQPAILEIARMRVRGKSTDTSELAETISSLKIELSEFPDYQSEKIQRLVDPVNTILDELVGKVANVGELLAKQQDSLTDLVSSRGKEINQFLIGAGYDYVFEVMSDRETPYVTLRHSSAKSPLTSPAITSAMVNVTPSRFSYFLTIA